MFRRATSSAVALVALFAAVAAASPAVTAAPALSRDAQAAESFWNELVSKAENFHIDAPKRQALLDGAVKAIAAEIEAGAFKGSDEYRKVIVNFLRGRIYPTVNKLVTVLDSAATAGLMDWKRLDEAAGRGVASALNDPFSMVLDPERFKKLMGAMGGERKEASLGVSLAVEGTVYKIAFIMYGTPAYDTELRVGDEIVAISFKDRTTGKEVVIKPAEVPQMELADKLAARPGDAVTLTVNRAGWAAPRKVTLIQRPTPKESVFYEMLPGKIGYIRTTMFTLTMARDVEQALKALEEGGMEALILDLRNNPGGALPACVSVADKFLPGGKLISATQARSPFLGGVEYKTRQKGTHPDLPLVCLVNGMSASASEMLSGALQDHKRARLVGKTTYGKGVGQAALPVTSKPGWVFYMTVMSYTLPSGRSINHKGVDPDVVCEQGAIDAASSEGLIAAEESNLITPFLMKLNTNDNMLLAGFAADDAATIDSLPGLADLYRTCTRARAQDPRAIDKTAFVQYTKMRARAVLADNGGLRILTDLQFDAQLKRGVEEIAAMKAGRGK